MIRRIHLQNFRRHRDLALNLDEGLQTLRAPNEAGKTTVLEGIAYALFGAKALRNSLAETVTWGCKESELKAEVVYEAAPGATWVFTRSKAGAEVRAPGSEQPHVTGQTEVSNFAAELLGADVSVAAHLMMSSQGGLRGVLDQGPKATANLIETLSNLDLIDQLIEKAGERLSLGSTTTLESMLKEAEDTLASMEPEPEPEKPDLSAHEAELKVLTAAVEEQRQITAAIVNQREAEAKKREKAEALGRDRRLIGEQAGQTQAEMDKAKAQLSPALPDLNRLRAAVAEFAEAEGRRDAYRAFKSMPPVNAWFSRELFESEMKQADQEMEQVQKETRDLGNRIALIAPQLSDNSRCPTCGQDTSHLESMRQKQAQLRDEKAEIESRLASLEFMHKQLAFTSAARMEIVALDRQIQSKLPALRQYATVDFSHIPVKVEWIGSIPGGDPSLGADLELAQARLAAAEKTVQDQNKLQGQIEAFANTLAALNRRHAEIGEAIGEIKALANDDFAILKWQAGQAEALLAEKEERRRDQELTVQTAQFAYEQAMLRYAEFKAAQARQAKKVATLRSNIEDTIFNNALVKKLRAARPLIANKLWNLILATVSTLFSQMRGEASVVAKDKNGFTVNGRPVESLSGSTLDILGLAIRCALVKTFIPACPFLILDEPSAACDAERSSALLGFVAGCGFRQTILVTHEEMAEAVSTNFITLGE